MEKGILHLNEIKTDRTPLKTTIANIPEVQTEKEMSNFDSSFLCGLLEEYRPRKIVEVGVSSGGTTAIILHCLQELHYPYEMYSVELLEHVYHKPEMPAGYLGETAKTLLDVTQHQLFTGTILPKVIEEIGSGIDFLILDTTHRLPGEVLDFLTAFPYLTENAVVCMHDIRQNFKNTEVNLSIATNALFACVAAEKYINEDIKRTHGYPNIGAFQINPDTEKYITNVASSLMLPWKLMPNEDMIAAYMDFISAHYGEEVQWICQRAIALNRDAITAMKEEKRAAEFRAKEESQKPAEHQPATDANSNPPQAS